MKKIKGGCETQVKMLQDVIFAYEKINERRGDAIFKSFLIVKEL